MVDNPDRIISANFLVNTNMKAPVISNDDIALKVITNQEIVTYMTQNPYHNMPKNWEHLHNSGYNNIVVGVYGNVADKDQDEKKEMLLRFKNKLDNRVKSFDFTINNEYFCAIGSNKEKIKKYR